MRPTSPISSSPSILSSDWISPASADSVKARNSSSSKPGSRFATAGIGLADAASRLSLRSSRATSLLNQQSAAVELPRGDFSRRGVLPHDIADPVVIKVAGRHHILTRRRAKAPGPEDLRVPPQEPDGGDAVGVAP